MEVVNCRSCRGQAYYQLTAQALRIFEGVAGVPMIQEYVAMSAGLRTTYTLPEAGAGGGGPPAPAVLDNAVSSTQPSEESKR